MNPRRLLRTSAVRLALRYALLYGVLMAVALGALYWSISGFVDVQLAAGLRKTMDALEQSHAELPPEQFRALLKAEIRAAPAGRLHVLLVSADGRVEAGDLRGWPADLQADGEVHNLVLEDDLLPSRREDRDAYWPVLARPLPDGHRLLVTHGLEQAEALLDFTQGTIAAVLAVSLALALGLGVLQGRSLLQRIDPLIDTTRAIRVGQLDRRVPVSSQDDEFDELAGQFNAMLERIQALMEGMRQVTDNVAHDLRRPLSRVRNLLDVTLSEPRDRAEYQEAIGRALTDLDELIHTFNALMEIAQAEAGSFRGEWGPVDLSALAEELAELYGDQAEEQGRTLELALEPGVVVIGNRHLLAQAQANLLDNALKFSPPGTPVRLELATSGGRVHLQVVDRGPGIPAAERERVVKRFERLDDARSAPGSGLGLSLVAAMARLHHARLELDDAGPGLCARLDFAEAPCG
ncbi:sensor histidine kinase [Endothiovibrio diazotrophicus]